MPRKSYNQFCSLARALDHIGDRWTLLIVRELLLGPRGFGKLKEALPGIATNLLTQRLKQLENDAIVRRSAHNARSKAVTYELTEQGRALEPTILELVRWGARWMHRGPGQDYVDGRWTSLALGAMLTNSSMKNPRGELLVEADGHQLTIAIGPSGRGVQIGASSRKPRAVLRGPFKKILAIVASEVVPESASNVEIEGDQDFVRAVLASTRTKAS